MSRHVLSNRGFSLVEVIVVMAVFLVILAVTGSALQTVLEKGSIVQKSEESNIEGVIGLEMLRHDLTQAGFGLFTDETSIPDFDEASGVPASQYNDADSVPRPIVTGNNLALGNNAIVLANTDYLAIKATSVGRTETANQWTYVTDSGVPHQWGINDFQGNQNKLIVLDQIYDSKALRVLRTLRQISNTNYAISYDPAGNFRDMSGNVVTDYTPTAGKQYYLYGIGTDNVAFTLRAPFNRVDYFVRRLANETPANCSPDAGVLYKGVMNHGNGSMQPVIPIMDCVADMQIVLGWNTQPNPESSNSIDAFSNAAGTAATGSLNGITISAVMADASEVRKRLRQVKVYLLVQDGSADRNFINTNNAFVVGNTALGEAPLTNTVDLTVANKRNYRWKLQRVVVRPKNLY